jgi:hypothetical protein
VRQRELPLSYGQRAATSRAVAALQINAAHVLGFWVRADSSSPARDFFCCSGDSVWYGGAFSSLAGGFSSYRGGNVYSAGDLFC